MGCECTQKGFCAILGKKLDHHSWLRCHTDQTFHNFIRQLAGKNATTRGARRRERGGRSRRHHRLIRERRKPKFRIKFEHIPETLHKVRCGSLDPQHCGRANCPKGGVIWRYPCDIFGVCTTRANTDSLISCSRCPLYDPDRDTLAWELEAEKVVQPTRWKVGITTAPGRDCLGDTIEQLRAAGFEDITVFAEPGVQTLPNVTWHQNRHKLGAWGNRFNGLCLLTLSDPSCGVLMCEDDIRIKPEAKALLERLGWDEDSGVATLYKPGGKNLEKYREPAEDGWMRVHGFLWGSLAVAFSPYLLTKFLGDKTIHEKDRQTPNYSDTRIYYWCARNGRDLMVASPSMVDHRSELPSTIHSHSHTSSNARAHDFDRYDVTLITPTRDRPRCFRLCEHWMSQQTFKGSIQWIVVDDSREPILPTMGQEHIRRTRSRDEPRHTLALNLRAAIPHIKSDRILIIEDDDYYEPDYIERMLEGFTGGDLVGFRDTDYYHVPLLRRKRHRRTGHAALSSTGFTPQSIPALRDALLSDHVSVDLRVWEGFEGQKNLIEGPSPVLSMKGMGEARNVSRFKGAGFPDTAPDPYIRISQGLPPFELIQYSCNFGGVDKIDPKHGGIMFGGPPAENWVVHQMESSDHVHSSRFAKMNPHLILPEAEWTFYCDANCRLYRSPAQLVSELTGDADVYLMHMRGRTIAQEARRAYEHKKVMDYEALEQQMIWQEERGTPRTDECYSGACIVRRNTPAARRFGEIWWDTFERFEGRRDQISLPHAIRQSGVKVGRLPHEGSIMRRGKHIKGYSRAKP